MPIVDDWKIEYVGVTPEFIKEIIHIDGILSYDGNLGTAPSLNDYIRGTTTGAVARVIAGSDLGGISATGTLTLTNVVGRFDDNEPLEVLSAVPFDTVSGTPQGFKLDDVVTGPTTESLTVKAIEFNEGPKVAIGLGQGVIYGNALTIGFADNEAMSVSANQKALVKGSEDDNSALFSSALANGTLAVPGAANTNNSEIVHYDAGTIEIPEDAHVGSSVTSANGIVAQKIGDVVTGSLRLIDSDTSGGAWTDNNGLELEEVVFYNNQVAGEVFLEGDLIRGVTSLKEFRVLPGGIIDDGDSTGKLVTRGGQGVMTLNEELRRILPGDIDGPVIAGVENTTTVLSAAILNLPSGTRKEQRAEAGISQGGIYGPTVSLNIRRWSNAFLSYIKTEFSKPAQLDDKPALDGNVRDGLYTVKTDNAWQVPTLSFRSLERGAWKDDGKNNIYTSYDSGQNIFTGKDITNSGWLQTSTSPRPMPNAYLEQGGVVVDPFWIEGPFSVILKVKTTTDVTLIKPATPALGQLINNGKVTWLSRPYGRRYAHFDLSDVGKVAGPVLDNKDDTNNNTGQYRYAFNTGGAGAFTVGEEITTADGTKVGIVFASGSGATGTVDYALLSTAQFADTNVITGAISGKTATLNVAGLSNLVAGYGTNIRTMVVDIKASSSLQAVVTGTFFVGEPCTQAVTVATGFILHHDTVNDELYIEVNTGTFSGDNNITGDTSAASWNPGVTTNYAAQTTVPKDLGEGTGGNNYAGVSSADITGASAQNVLKLYEWDKFLNNEKNLTVQGGRGSLSGRQGRLYRGFDPTFAEVNEAPYGSKGGAVMFGAEGHFIQKETLLPADLQNIRVTPIGGSELTPPNLQSAQVANLQAAWEVLMNRSLGVDSKDILTTEFTAAAGNAAGNSVIVLAAGTRSVSPLPTDIPDTGSVEVEDPSNPGIFLEFPYNAVNRATNTFTLTSGTIGDVTGGSALTTGDDAHVSWIHTDSTGSTLSNSIQFIGVVDLVMTARRKGFDDVTLAQQFTSTGVIFAINRTPDGVVNLP